MSDRVKKGLLELTVVYAKAKYYALLAEEYAEEARSNIGVIKEKRDALDHLVLALSLITGSKEEADEVKILIQIDKAKGHLYRAAYDSIDGVIICLKNKIKALNIEFSHSAITAIYPTYYTERVPKMTDLEQAIASHRAEKSDRDNTLESLENYCADAQWMADFFKEVSQKTPACVEWDQRRKKEIEDARPRLHSLHHPLTSAVVGGAVVGCGFAFFNGGNPPEQKASALKDPTAQAIKEKGSSDVISDTAPPALPISLKDESP